MRGRRRQRSPRATVRRASSGSLLTLQTPSQNSQNSQKSARADSANVPGSAAGPDWPLRTPRSLRKHPAKFALFAKFDARLRSRPIFANYANSRGLLAECDPSADFAPCRSPVSRNRPRNSRNSRNSPSGGRKGSDDRDRLFSGGLMPTLLDHLETQPAESWNRPVTTSAAERLRTTMAACRVAVHLVGRPAGPDGRAEGPGRPGVRRRGPVPLRRQEAARHQAHGLPRRHRHPHQDRRLLEGALAAVPRAGHPADQAGGRRGLRSPDGRLQGRAGRRRRQPRPPLRRAEAVGRPAARLAVQRRPTTPRR